MSKIPLVFLATAITGITLLPQLQAGASGARVHYVGGTGTSLIEKSEVRIELTGDDDLLLGCKGASLRVPYSTINTLEYGQKVDRRVLEAIIISPLMLLAKHRTHFLTIGYTDVEGRQQAMVFRVESGDVRSLLVGLEARTGRKVEYQDDEARKAGKG
jgi:hypothetical protein